MLDIDNFHLTDQQTIFLRKIARRNWSFFKTFIGPDDNWLPVDNFQEGLDGRIDRRVSPTDMGLGLLASLAAYDLGYITSARLIERVSNTFDTMDKLDRYRGHFYNWYATDSLKPFRPLYISTVDSGNLVACILTLRAAFHALPDKDILCTQLFVGLRDALYDLQDSIAEVLSHNRNSDLESAQIERNGLLSKVAQLLEPFCQSMPSLTEARQSLVQLTDCSEQILQSCSESEDSDSYRWSLALNDECSHALETVDYFMPWLDKLAQLEQARDFTGGGPVPTLRYLAKLDGSSITLLINNMLNIKGAKIAEASYRQLEELVACAAERARICLMSLDKLTRRASQFAEPDWDFLFDKKSNLFSIGFNVKIEKCDAAHYDQLVSEARLTYFVAIAQEQIDQSVWSKLGRKTILVDGKAALLSWQGSMLEYLMPLLVMPDFTDSPLGQSYALAVRAQIEHGEKHKIPWGMSPSSYNAVDEDGHYKYGAFGVPKIAMMEGLGKDRVVAPHATALALMIAPQQAVQNLEHMAKLGFLGKYGFYDAIDYTAERVPPNKSHVIVSTFMSHHQGMTLLAITKLLLESPMQELFQSDPQLKKHLRLLQE